MHRLLSARSLYPNSFHVISLPPGNALRNNNSIPEMKCSFCQKIFVGHLNIVSDNQAFVRHQSTKAASALRALKKKTKHKNHKKYGVVLEVSEKAMTESKVSISKLRASHLSQLASSSITLEQLHQLTVKTNKKSLITEVDTELLKTVREKILKSSSKPEGIVLEDDECALVFTHQRITNIENRLKTKQYLDMVKQSYYNFRKATIYDQRLQDLRYAIHEGLNQEFDFERPHNGEKADDVPVQKGPHAVFRELFIDNQLDNYDHELMSHISNMQSRGMAHSTLEDLYDDPSLEARDEMETEHESIEVQTLNVKKAKQAIRKKKKAKREKRRALQELSMKQDIKEIERRGKQEALQRMLAAHMELLCSINMAHEGRQVLQYYRQKSSRPEHPKVKDVMVFNILLHGYASAGLLENTKELLSFMANDKIKPNAQTFAAVFECIERSVASDKLTLLNFYHRQMQENGITLNDLMDKSYFLYDQHDMVLSAIRKLQPDFNPQYTPPPLDYVCPLLEKLTLDKVENREGLRSSPAEGLLSVDEMVQRGKDQLEVEMKGEVDVQNIYISDTDSEDVQKYRKLLEDTENEWRQVLKEAFVRNLGTLKSQSNASHSAITLYPYLNVLTVNQFVDLMMGEISKLVDGSETYSPTLKVLQRDLGTHVYQKYKNEQSIRNGVLDKKKDIFEKYCRWYMNRDSGTPYNSRQMWQLLLHENRGGASLDVEEHIWPTEIRQNIGKLLYNIIINDIKIDVNMFKAKSKVKKLPAVYKVHRAWGRLFRLELKPHPCVARLCAAGSRSTLRMRTPLLPTLAPPEPWRRVQPGLVRMPINVMSQWKRLYEAPPESLYPVLDSLNQLGEVPWVVNKPILDLQLQIFRSGGDKKLEIASPSSSLDTSTFSDTSAYKRRAAVSRAKAEMHSLWCDALYKLSLANHYRDIIFWLPHNMDFRGRVYACPPHLSQLGADTARALMKFAKRQPLGPDGLQWLKLHAVNLTGSMKKKTVEERLNYADSIMDKMLDSADRPLEGAGWWKQSEEPWQTLACCMEIANALRCDNPAEYLCGFPVHQDGSCNGLQHYAALGGDAAGAAAVNLAPLPRPQDVYSAVCALVEEMRKRDAAAGLPAAIVLENFVRRKVIKQTVMTTVYGVTRFGARLQIAKQLKDIEEFPKEHVWACSQYLTTKTFDSLREMFTSTKLIQDWFTDCAKLISCVCGESVEWVTPLGLPVVQPYYRRAAPSSQHYRASLDHLQRPCTMKQRNAFPPNFIHSLDSSHMMLTGTHCQAEGLTFVSVHDCFWTHPNTVPLMNQICREQFVALHSQPILEDLSDFMVQRYSYAEDEIKDQSVGSANKKRVNSLLQKVPSKGDFDLNGVLKSVYFFS